jgi:phosphoserine aminotransferase
MIDPEKDKKPGKQGLVAGRVFNFNGGPAALPVPVLEQAAEEMLNWRGSGMSIMENSHRDKKVVAMAQETEELLKEIIGLDSAWKVLFLQGGASLQFAMIPMNFAPDGLICDYINTGMWSEKAYREALICGAGAKIIASSQEEDFTYIPSKYYFSPGARYIYLTSNNTVRGTEWKLYPEEPPCPLVADMSSNFLSKPIDLTYFALIHAGAQKNVGPAGLTIVLVNKQFAMTGKEGLPHLLDYRTYIDSDSMYNTPPVFSIYVANLVFKWIRDTMGGLTKMEAFNKTKSSRLYKAIDGSGGFYRGTAKKDSRSRMNVTYRLPSPELEKTFLEEAKSWELYGLNGHRSVGGIRASLYNAVPLEAVDRLVEFMKDFQGRKG